MNKQKAPKNRTLALNELEKSKLTKKLALLKSKSVIKKIENKIINQDFFEAVKFLPDKFIDLLIIDPPYNLNKSFNQFNFKSRSINQYSNWFESVIVELLPKLKSNSSLYVCSDWKSSTSIHLVLEKYFKVRNRITWEREKGRGANKNWKNNSEDIWFATVSDEYTFNLDAVKLKRKVIAPYKNTDGTPKDWEKSEEGSFRLTYPSNIWNDISIPFWSMPENTDHPTQKPEKLIAKLILASSNKNDFIFDPFSGSGTTLVAAKKLGRKFSGIELDKDYSLLSQKRLEKASKEKSIQGYFDGVFWERNSFKMIKKDVKKFA
ncbi:MAG: site-specific DNA-methyltransferase [Melioribacteraceae bacterium]|nr:site-specific DNA-methyltransferase [Melioribacteraceae bacterium]